MQYISRSFIVLSVLTPILGFAQTAIVQPTVQHSNQPNKQGLSVVQQENNTYTEKKLSIVVTQNQPQFTLQLISNPSTGYSWFLRGYDPALLQPVKHYYQAMNASGMPGAAGFEYWVFKVKPVAFVVPQQFTLRMVYARPWQSDDNPSEVVFRVMTK